MLFAFVKNIKKSFTLLEVLIVCGFFSIVILAIIWAINRAYVFMNNTRMQVRAVNFAREWVEMVFNIRDTNWRKHSWERDKYWNNLWTWDVNNKFQQGIYVLNEWGNSSGDVYIYSTGLNVNAEDFYWDEFWDTNNVKNRESAKIIFTWTYNYLGWDYDEGWEWQFKSETWDIWELLWSEGDFYRIVRVYNVVGKLTSCIEDKCPKEMRFCVKVFYKSNDAKRSTELCSIMTNFEE